MADPISLGTMAMIGMGTTAAGGGISAIGSVMGGESASQASAFRAGIADTNARVAQINRDRTIAAGGQRAERAGMQSRQQMGRLRVAQSGSGLDMTSGTSKLVQESQQAAASEDQRTIYDNTAAAAYGYEVKAMNERASASMERASGKAAKDASYLKALGTIIGTAGSVAGKWQHGSDKGLWGGSDEGPWVGSATEWSA